MKRIHWKNPDDSEYYTVSNFDTGTSDEEIVKHLGGKPWTPELIFWGRCVGKVVAEMPAIRVEMIAWGQDIEVITRHAGKATRKDFYLKKLSANPVHAAATILEYWNNR